MFERLPFLFHLAVSKYVFAVVCVLLAVLLRKTLDPILTENQLVLSFFYIAVLATSWFGELYPAIFCAILGFLATDWFFLAPRNSLFITKQLFLANVASYFSVTLPIIFFGYLMRRNEEAQKKEKIILQTVMNASEEFHLAYLDREFNFVLVNETYARTGGYKPEEMIGKNHFALYPHHENEGIFRRVRDSGVAAQFRDKPFVYPGDVKRGVTYWDWTLVPVKDEKGRVKGLVLSRLETTERKRAEEILKRDKEDLEEIVRQRTAKLLRAERELDKAKRLSDIGALASTVAHELRNPLAAINMASHNIKRRIDYRPVERQLTTIGKKVGESEQIINNLLFYSRLRQPHFEAINISGVVKEVVQLVEAILPRNIELEDNSGALKNVIIEADPLQIKEVLSNILNNAVDAAKDREQGRIEVRGSEDKDSARVEIRDNGTGMSKETMLNAMEAFYSTKSKGTGLGLAVSKQIIDLHNGSIKLESEIGKGTTVTICFPKSREIKAE